jgi:hypothetical protein
VNTAGGSGCKLDWLVPVSAHINETKAVMIGVMGEFGRPMTSAELYAIWDGAKPLQTIEYHLSTLVKANVVELVFGPELHFQLAPAARDPKVTFQGAVPLGIAESKCTEL